MSKGLTWMAALPAFKIADEPSHFENIQFRAETGEAPRYDGSGREIDRVMNKRSSLEMRALWRLHNRYFRSGYLHNRRAVPEERDLAELALKPEFRQTDGQVSSMNYPGFYYGIAVLPYRWFQEASLLHRIMAVRCLSLLFGILAALSTYLAARRILGSPALSFAAAVMVALQPMASQMTVAVNNDAALIGVSAALFYVQIHLITDPADAPSIRWLILLIALSTAAVFTKPHAYALLPGSAVAAGVRIWPVLRSSRAVRAPAALLGLVVIGIGLWHAWSSYQSGRLLPIAVTSPQGPSSFISFLEWLDPDYTWYLFKSAWGQFGWLEYSLQGRWLELIGGVSTLVCIGIFATYARQALRPQGISTWPEPRSFTFSICIFTFVILFILYAEYRFRTAGISGVIQGRNFLYGLPPLAIVVTGALASLVPTRFRTLCAAAVVTGAFSLNVGGLMAVLRYHNVG